MIMMFPQAWDPTIPGLALCPRSEAEVTRWAEEGAGQSILLTTPSLLIGERVSVYRVEVGVTIGEYTYVRTSHILDWNHVEHIVAVCGTLCKIMRDNWANA